MSFISARVLINKKVGDKAILKQAGKDIVFEIINISYSQDVLTERKATE